MSEGSEGAWMGACFSWGAGGGGEEVDDASLDGQLDPSVDELAEAFVDGEPLAEGSLGSCPDEAADRFAAVDVGQFVVRAVPLGVFRVRAAAARASADLVLFRDASRVHGAEALQFGLNASDFRFEGGDRGCLHGRLCYIS